MATIDLSRSATDFRKHFTSVRAQMGRVFTDDDHNENERLRCEDGRRSLIDMIGPDGSPDDGFLIKNPTVTAGKINFDISPGSFYLGGNRLDLEQVEQFQVQSDWVNMSAADEPAAPAGHRFDLAYLECWHQPVSAVEDSELFEKGLGGPDTGVRMRLMRRVHVAAGTATGDCHVDWSALTATWAAAGLGTLNAQDELAVNTKLTVGFEAGGNPVDLCTPPVAGGYLGAENQAIRVQLVDASHFTWGADNAAPLYRVNVGPNGLGQLRKITMITEPKDQAHWPVAGKIVEILPWSAVLANKEKVSEVSGFLARIDTSYDPDTQELFVAADVPIGLGGDWLGRPDAAALKPEFFYMRVWDRGTDTASPPAIPFVTGTAVKLGNTGLNITFTGTDHRPADFWIIAARPGAPNHVVPWLLESGRGPHGIHRYYAVLGVIEWTAGGGGKVIHDCREKFPPLTRISGCCTFTVGDDANSFGAYTSIQAAIDALPAEGGEICLLPGAYLQNWRIVNRHDIRIHGCGTRTLLKDDGGAKGPVITIQDSQRIEICDVAIEAPKVIAIQIISTPAAEANKSGVVSINLDDMKIAVCDTSAIDCRGGSFIHIRRNEILAEQLSALLSNGSGMGKAPLVFVRADDVRIEANRILATAERRLLLANGGVQVGGGSERVEIRHNHIEGGNGNGITLGSLTYIAAPAARPPGGLTVASIIENFGWVIDANGCLQPDPDPQDPNDPGGRPLVPVSDGDLLDIRIIENDILKMGSNGISTLRYFKKGFGPIVVRDLDIEQNRIRHCVQLELGDKPFAGATPIGFGGISLIAAENVMLRTNWIEENGTSYIDPICGVFLASVRGFVAEDNVITGNGPWVASNKQPTTGPRGGIVVVLGQTPYQDDGDPALRTERIGSPAVRIAGNNVVVPHGRALWLVGRGTFSVEGNDFTSRGVERDGNLQGVVVVIWNMGVAYEAGLFIGFANFGTNEPASVPSGLIGGEVLFNDNQALLAPVDTGDLTIQSSIFMWSADDIMLDGNQCECRLAQQNLNANAAIFAWSVRVNGNRFQERIQSQGLSALTLAMMNCTANNQGTRCFTVISHPVLAIRGPNRSLITLAGKDICDGFNALVAGAIKSSGLDA